MAGSVNGWKRAKAVSILELIMAGGFLAFWAAYFLTDMADIADPRLREVYLAFESAFPPADILLAIVLAAGGIGLLRAKPYGRLFTVAGGGALVFLGLLDVSFNLRQGIYGLGPEEAVLNGTINFACLASGILLIHTIWVVAMKDAGKGGERPEDAARQGR